MKSIKAIFRRGHKEGPGNPDNLSRTSSITNLDSLEASLGKGAKPRKAASKERIDKQSHDGKKVTKNNNKLDPPAQPQLSYSSDSLQNSEAELLQLRKQLRDMADEKSSLALQLGEQRGQLNVLQNEILKLKCFQEESNLEMEKLAEENTVLRNRLRDVAHSPLSDNEKQQLLFENRHHSSAPASITTNVIEDTGGDATTCTTPDWDKQSSGNVSEVSVACLQDKINQMQETHYSTNEELQATLQELTDLQRQLTELQQENERLNEEKTLMFDSLCRQTDRLKESRLDVEKLNQMIYRSDESGINQLENAVEREQQLVEVLRTAQDEREQLLLKLDQIQGDLQDSRKAHAEKAEALAQLTERLKTLECTLDAKNAEHKQLDQELTQTKDQYSGKQIEVDRLSDLLETARTKIIELEQDRDLSDKSELDEMLDNARKEKDQLESEVTYLKEQLARSKNEIEKLKEQVFMLQEECKVTRNNAKTTQADLEYKCEKVVAEKNNLGEQLQHYQDIVNELQLQSQCHLEDKRQLSAVLSETQRNMSETERRNINLENELLELKKLREEENDEWEKFQNDLLTSVRVANDFKTEAQQELQKIILENKTFREKVRLLEGQLEKLKGEKTSTPTQTDIILTPQLISLAKNLDPSIPNRVSLLEKQESENMEKLFPILSRKSKSKENLADVSTLSGHRRQRSEDTGDRSKTRVGLTKSKDDLEQYAKEKGPRGFSIWNRSKENVAAEDEPKEKKSFFKRNKSQEDLDKPRKSKDSGSSDSIAKMIKRRDKKPVNRSKVTHPKFMSVEEEMLLQSLDSWYQNIDKNTPDEFLTQEEKAVRKLKILYEDDALKEKPFAHKPKEHLAISKPLLNSVVLNPKLEQICRDPKLFTVQPEVRESALEDPSSARVEEIYTNMPPIFKSKSLEDINVFEEYRTESSLAPVMYGTTTEVDNRSHFTRVLSDIEPNDSVSNPRRSVMYHELPKPNVYINYENLDEIVDKIPKNVSENRLTEEQKFAKKLKSALDEAEKKTTLKKSKKKMKSIRGQEISAPTRESVEQNWKLKQILLNPGIKAAEEPRKRHSTDISSYLGSPQESPKLHNSKSYEDISFSFVPENTLLHMHYGEQIKLSKYTTESSSSSSQSFTSAEFNLDTGKIVQKCDLSQQEDLLYNDTITQTKEAKVNQLKRELSVQEEEEIRSLRNKILEAKQQYPIQLQESLKRIHHDQLRDSLRKQRSKMDKNGNMLPLKYEDVAFQKAVSIADNRKSVHFEEQTIFNEDKSVQFEPEVPIGFRDETRSFEVVKQSFEVNDHSLAPGSDENFKNDQPSSVLEYHNKLESVSSDRPEEENEVHRPDVSQDNVERKTLEYYPVASSPNSYFDRHSDTPYINSSTHSLHQLSPSSPEIHDADGTQDNVDACEAKQSKILNEYPVSNSSFHRQSSTPYKNSSRHSSHRHSLPSPVVTEAGDRHDIVDAMETKQSKMLDQFQRHSYNPYEKSPTNTIHRLSLPSPEEFHYKQTLKENRYGVVSPLDLRYTYRHVVEEYKEKFPSEEEISPRSDQDYLENVDDFIDEFFRPVFAPEVEEDLNLEEVVLRQANSKIDEEMNEIMEKYLHTRASLLVKNLDEHPPKTNLRKYETMEELGGADEVTVATPAMVIESASNSDDEALSLQDLQFIEEMKSKYASSEMLEDEPIEEKKSRPLSEINEQDLRLIDEIVRRSTDDDDVPPPLPLSPIPTKSEDRKSSESLIPVRNYKPLPPSLRPKNPQELPINQYSNVTFRNSSHVSSPAPDDRHSKRLSELMFKETIFVPMEQEAEPPTLSFKQQNSYRESVFVASPEPASKIPTPTKFSWGRSSSCSPNSPKYQSYKETIFVTEESHNQRNSWTDSLKKGLLDNSDTSYEPVYYSNVLFHSKIPKSVSKEPSISKKPLPLPRVSSFRWQEHLRAGVTSPVNTDTFDTMSSSNENFSEVNKSPETQPNNEIAGDILVEEVKRLPTDLNDLSADAILVDQSKARTDIFKNTSHHEELELGEMTEPDEQKKGAQPKPPENEAVEEVPKDQDHSNVNLFHMDSESSYSSYLELFKTKESKEFDSLRGKKHQKTAPGFAYVEEILAEDSSSVSTGDIEDMNEYSGPKIVGFVPLDNNTTPVFCKPEENNDCVKHEETVDPEPVKEEEEKKKDNLNCSLELLAKKSSLSSSRSQSSSRTSFSQARKIFEALEEAHMDEPIRPKSAMNPKSQPRVSVRDSRSLEHIRAKSSEKEGVGERGLSK